MHDIHKFSLIPFNLKKIVADTLPTHTQQLTIEDRRIVASSYHATLSVANDENDDTKTESDLQELWMTCQPQH